MVLPKLTEIIKNLKVGNDGRDELFSPPRACLGDCMWLHNCPFSYLMIEHFYCRVLTNREGDITVLLFCWDWIEHGQPWPCPQNQASLFSLNGNNHLNLLRLNWAWPIMALSSKWSFSFSSKRKQSFKRCCWIVDQSHCTLKPLKFVLSGQDQWNWLVCCFFQIRLCL